MRWKTCTSRSSSTDRSRRRSIQGSREGAGPSPQVRGRRERRDEVALTTTVLGKLKNKGITTVDHLEGFLGYFNVKDLPKFTVSDEVITDIFLPKRRA